MLSKKEFVKAINNIQETMKFMNKFENLLGCTINKDFCISETIFLLEKLMNAPLNHTFGSDIQYFIFELNFGKSYKEGMIKDGEKIIDFSTAGKLYDYLVSIND